MTSELRHFHDPMCSWCWAFRPVWVALCAQLPADVAVRRVVGGLAPDSDAPMPPEMRLKLQDVWRTIQVRVPGTRFNFAFWEQNTPRRATYNACRAVLAAVQLSPTHEEPMILAIQHAYYLKARNPSDVGTLVDLATEIGLDRARFSASLTSAEVQTRLDAETAMARSAPINGFPSLVLHTPWGQHPLRLDYCDAAPLLQQIQAILSQTGRPAQRLK